MNSSVIIEAVGYLGSGLVVISMLMTSVKKLRIINTIGSIIFVIYALIIKSYPTAAMNVFLVGINIYNLIKMGRDAKNYTIVECYKDESLIQLYLNSNIEDINSFFPDFSSKPCHQLAFLVSNKSEPVGIMLGTMEADGFDVQLDYTTPAYRDCSVGKALYKYLEDKWGVSKFIFSVNAVNHDKYLDSMGYKKEENCFVRIKDNPSMEG